MSPLAPLKRGTCLKLNKEMKQITILIFFIANLAVAQDSTSVQVIARPLPNKIMLRWAVDQPLAWKKANEHGFLLERATISRNGEAVVPIERQMLTPDPLRPKPLAEWETLATQDQNAAVLAQALYGDSFETTVPGSQMGAVFAVNDELEQRFTFALLAAEQNYEAAKLAGWGFEDSTVKKGEKYIYTVSVAVTEESNLQIAKATVYASTDMYEELPSPIGLVGVFGDGHVALSWNFNLLQNLYTNYIVERSEDNRNFERLNGAPLFNAQQPKDAREISLFYTDSIPNDKTYHYRIKGKTAFGETGPASDALNGKATENLGFVPRIYKKEIPTDNKAILYWEFDEKGNRLITGFELRHANNNKGPYRTVKGNIPITTRKIAFEGLERSNYFTIVAMGKNGIESESYPTLVQPVDSIPPKPPIGLKGVMDTTGIIRLNWTKNLEEDLSGYRIFKANNPDAEFSEVTGSAFRAAAYTDTVQAANLNKKIYYKIQAEDQRYNRSQFSEILIVDKPDRVPPSPAVLTKYEATQEGIRINWIPSSSPDVASHVVYRKNGEADDALWSIVFESAILRDTSFLDTEELERNVYSYTVVAKDSTGLESEPANPMTVIWNGETISTDDIKFTATPNRELRFINLSWKVKNDEVIEYRLYRGTSENNLRLYKTLDGTAKGYNDVDLEVNTNYSYGLQLVMEGGVLSEIRKLNVNY